MTDVAFNNNTEKIDGKRGHLKHFLHADLDQQQIMHKSNAHNSVKSKINNF